MWARLKRHFTKLTLPEWAFALLIGVALTFLAEWTFGEEFVTRQQARAYAPFSGWRYGEGRRDDIRVLLIDDAALEDAGQQWPARYSYSARLLRTVGQYRPRAVFVDIYYSAIRNDDSLPALLRQVCALHEQGVKVFMAAARNREEEYLLRPELEELAGKCFEKVAVSYTPDEVDRLAWNYTLAAPGKAHGAHGMKSAALALYETGGGTASVEHHPMALTWGSEPARHGIGWVNSVHGAEADASYCRESHGLWDILPVGPRNLLFGDAGKPVCVFHETIRAGELTSTSAQEDARLRRLIEGKILLIGTALSSSSDLVLSPLHGRIPGVYLHAMALDNLMRFGDGYARAMHLALDLHNIKLLLFVLPCMALVIFVSRTIVHPLTEHWKPDEERRWWRAALYVWWRVLCLLAAVPVACCILLFGQYVLGLGFLSIINAIVLTLLAEWFEFPEQLSQYIYFEKPESKEASHADHAIPTYPDGAVAGAAAGSGASGGPDHQRQGEAG